MGNGIIVSNMRKMESNLIHFVLLRYNIHKKYNESFYEWYFVEYKAVFAIRRRLYKAIRKHKKRYKLIKTKL